MALVYRKGISASLGNFTNAQIDSAVADFISMGVGWVRMDFDWPSIEPANGTYDTTTYDYAVAALSAAGINVLGIIDYCPGWANGGGSQFKPPTSNSTFAAYCTYLANRYKSSGVHTWEIWNEPNISVFWETPSASAYKALLQAAYTALKAADPSCTVILAGCAPASDDGTNINAVTFLTGVYTAGGKNYFDAVGAHPYTYTAMPANGSGDAWDQMSTTSPSLRSVMTANSDSAKKIWMTEVGFPTATAVNSAETEANQNTCVGAVYSDANGYSWAGPVFWYTYQDSGTDTANEEDWFGLIRYAGTHKPAYATYAAVTGPATAAISGVVSAVSSATARLSGAGVTTTIILTAGTSWPVPADWNSANNKIEVLGAGGGGAGGTNGVAGGGGGYSASLNVTLTPGASIAYGIGAGGAGGAGPFGNGVSGGNSWFSGTSLSSCVVGAAGGQAGGLGSLGGAASAGTGGTKYSGGNGGSNSSNGQCGGGGAAGPGGNGGAGGNGTGPTVSGAGGGGNGGGTAGSAQGAFPVGGAGGANRLGAGAGAAGDGSNAATAGTAGGGGGGGGVNATAALIAGAAGGNGTDLASGTLGSGGGGGGGGTWTGSGAVPAGGAGGLYGGGGGGGAVDTTVANGGTGGNGAPGIIVISYQPVGNLSGTSAALSSASGTLAGGGQLTATITAITTAGASFGSAGALSATIAAVSSISGNLTGTGSSQTPNPFSDVFSTDFGSGPSSAISGLSAAVTSATGNLTNFPSLFGSSAAITSATATLTGKGALSGSAVAASSQTSNLGTNNSLYGAPIAASSATGTLTGKGALIAQINGTSSATASLVVYGQLSGLSAAISGVTANLTATQSGSGGTSGGSGSIAQPSITYTPLPLTTSITPSTFDYRKTIISQYANSPVINALLENFDSYIDPTANIDNFFNLVWNVNTAQGRGLDVWGRIVGVGRVLQISSAKYFGFDEATPLSADPFNVSPFYSGGGVTSNYALADNGFRTLIFAKALANISDGSIPSINQILLKLFKGRGNCFVTDGGNMTMTYTFNFALTLAEIAIVSGSGVLPRPAGVSSTVIVNANQVSDVLGVDFYLGQSDLGTPSGSGTPIGSSALSGTISAVSSVSVKLGQTNTLSGLAAAVTTMSGNITGINTTATRPYLVGMEMDIAYTGPVGSPPQWAANNAWPAKPIDFTHVTLTPTGWSAIGGYPAHVPCIMTWQPVDNADATYWDLSALVAGAYDTQLEASISGITAFNILGFRIMQESNGSWFQWSQNLTSRTAQDGTPPGGAWTKATWIAAFRKCAALVRKYFPNAWVDWNVNVGVNTPTPYQTFADGYPGDDVVDCISIDFYQNQYNATWAAVLANNTFNPNSLVAFATQHNKRVGIGEFASGASLGQTGNVAWFNSLMAWCDSLGSQFLWASWYDLGVPANGGDTLYDNAYPALRAAWNAGSFGGKAYGGTSAPSAYTLKATATTGLVNVASAPFLIAAAGTLSASRVITPHYASGSGGTGTFSPATVTLAGNAVNPQALVAFIPATTGTFTITTTNDGTLTNPAGVTYIVTGTTPPSGTPSANDTAISDATASITDNAINVWTLFDDGTGNGYSVRINGAADAYYISWIKTILWHNGLIYFERWGSPFTWYSQASPTSAPVSVAGDPRA